MTKLCDFKRDNPTVLTWLKIFTNSKEKRTRNKLYN